MSTKKYEAKDYVFGNTIVRYVIMNDTKKVFLNLLPKGTEHLVDDRYESYPEDSQFMDCVDFESGALAHLHLSHHVITPACGHMKYGDSFDTLLFKSQIVNKLEDRTVIETLLVDVEGYEVKHILTNYDGEEGFEVQTVFVNKCGKTVRLEMLTSASLDNLSPFAADDCSDRIKVHTFRSGWAIEGKHQVYTIPELNMEKAWGGVWSGYKIGTKGSRATQDYYPYMAVEDTEANVTWGMALVHNSTWQADLTRMVTQLSLSCGIGDYAYSGWYKDVADGEEFAAPVAYIAAVKGDIADLSHVLLQMNNRQIDAYGEEGMGITFNEWCTTWGNPTHENMLKIANRLEKTKVKYFVMDAGWYDGKIGDWKVKESSFPKGMKAYTDEIRAMGYIPGIWMEFECTAEGSEMFESPRYDDLYLKRNGNVIIGHVNRARHEKFLDFRNPVAVEHLTEKVINFLKDGGFGYLKIDYNANIGIGCDGAESPSEGLRQHANAVAEFVKKIKEEIPDILIENCASGGMRHDRVMTGITGMSSFSDAHESIEFPIVAANLHYLIPPRQSQVWNVLKPEFDENRFAFTISAGFLGRICWSGDILGLSDAQMEEIYRAEELYEKVCGIIKYGKSRIYRTNLMNNRRPKGTQAVIRYSEDEKQALLVYHCYEDVKNLEIPCGEGWDIADSLYDAAIELKDGKINICETKEIFGNAVLLERK